MNTSAVVFTGDVVYTMSCSLEVHSMGRGRTLGWATALPSPTLHDSSSLAASLGGRLPLISESTAC